MSQRPAFEIRRIKMDGSPDGDPILIYSNGQVSGVTGGYMIINRIPQEIALARADERKLTAESIASKSSQWTKEELEAIQKKQGGDTFAFNVRNSKFGGDVKSREELDVREMFDAMDGMAATMDRFFKKVFKRS